MRALVLGRGKSGKAARALLEADGASVDFADGYDLVVASPGMRVMSELEYGVGKLRERGVKMIAVTGSKGKSSVVKLVADALGAVPCGNYGLPVSEVGECEWAVVEVSSFQLETTNLPPDAFEAAAILNLQEDHIDRHGSVAVYHALKRRLLSFAKTAFDCEAPPTGLLRGSYFDNPVLRANGFIAAALMRAAGLGDEAIAAAFAAFEPLPHRFQTVGEFGGVRCVDDSKATSVAALAAGVTMCGDSPVRLIAGGRAKGDDPKYALPVLTSRVKKVYLIGECAGVFSSAWSGSVELELCETLDRAVADAFGDSAAGETILLSPGAASFDQFADFGERGEVFAELVKKEGQNK